MLGNIELGPPTRARFPAEIPRSSAAIGCKHCHQKLRTLPRSTRTISVHLGPRTHSTASSLRGRSTAAQLAQPWLPCHQNIQRNAYNNCSFVSFRFACALQEMQPHPGASASKSVLPLVPSGLGFSCFDSLCPLCRRDSHNTQSFRDGVPPIYDGMAVRPRGGLVWRVEDEGLNCPPACYGPFGSCEPFWALFPLRSRAVDVSGSSPTWAIGSLGCHTPPNTPRGMPYHPLKPLKGQGTCHSVPRYCTNHRGTAMFPIPGMAGFCASPRHAVIPSQACVQDSPLLDSDGREHLH